MSIISKDRLIDAKNLLQTLLNLLTQIEQLEKEKFIDLNQDSQEQISNQDENGEEDVDENVDEDEANEEQNDDQSPQ